MRKLITCLAVATTVIASLPGTRPSLNRVLKPFFTANDTSADLTLSSLTGGVFPAFEQALGNVSLSPPALILSALAGLTLLSRRRRITNTSAY